MVHKFLGATLLLLASVSLGQADLVSEARNIQATLQYNEREINKIANVKVPNGIPAELRKTATECARLAEKCLASIKTAKVYAKKIELGDKSADTIKQVNYHLNQMRLSQMELEQRVVDLKDAIKSWQGKAK